MIVYEKDFESPTKNADVQEALSLRYGGDVFMVLPLRSGKIAVLGYFRALHALVDTFEEACEAMKSIEITKWQRQIEEKKAPPKVTSTLSLDDLGL
jgi:hypothetical protein